MLSVMSERSRHIPKNSEFSKSPSVRPLERSGDETTRTISAGPTGTSAGNVIRSSRSGGMSALRFTFLTTVFPLGAAALESVDSKPDGRPIPTDHQSTLVRLRLTSRALQLLFQIRRRWVPFAERILRTLADRYVVVHLVLVSQIEGDGAVDLLQA